MALASSRAAWASSSVCGKAAGTSRRCLLLAEGGRMLLADPGSLFAGEPPGVRCEHLPQHAGGPELMTWQPPAGCLPDRLTVCVPHAAALPCCRVAARSQRMSTCHLAWRRMMHRVAAHQHITACSAAACILLDFCASLGRRAGCHPSMHDGHGVIMWPPDRGALTAAHVPAAWSGAAPPA